jgi:hypothetical protein
MTVSSDGLSPEREGQLMVELLHERGGIDPDRVDSVTDLAALGLVNAAWRNTCIENWHAEGRMHDGDMLRINSHASWRVRQIMRRWSRETGLMAGACTSVLDNVPAEDVWQLAIRVYRWLVNPRRTLPTGATLAQLARDACRSTRKTPIGH